MAWRANALVAAAATAWLAGCDDNCVEVDASCAPLYEPTFDNIYDNTLSVSCSVGNNTCHTGDGSAAAGLAFTSPDQAYDALVGAGRVTAGDASCGLLSYRVETTGADGMPPGRQLAAPERCAITQWIANGAPR